MIRQLEWAAPLPDKLSHRPTTDVVIDGIPEDIVSFIPCSFGYPITKNIYCHNSTFPIEEYAQSDNGLWVRQAVIGSHGDERLIKSLLKVYSTTFRDTYYVVQCQRFSKNWPCVVHTSNDSIYNYCTCLDRDRNPYYAVVISQQQGNSTQWVCNCLTLTASDDIIYGIDNPAQSMNQVLRYKLNGTSLPSIAHENMKEPRFIKAADFSSGRLLVVSDSSRNKVFLFLNEQLCWEWKPQPSCKVGPVAFDQDQLSRGYIYVVSSDEEDVACITILGTRGNHNVFQPAFKSI